MGSKLMDFQFKTRENEEIETIVTIPKELRSVIHGIVKDHKGQVTKDAVVKLFELSCTSNKEELIPITHTFTDENGQFLFGPLTANKDYIIKVWVNNVEIRRIQLSEENYDDESYF